MRRYVVVSWLVVIPALAGCNAAPTSCETSRDCSGLVCDLSSNTCVECLTDVDCLGADEVCVAHACEVRTPCETSRQCPGQVCDLSVGYCVECVVSVDCAGTQICEARVCVDPPTTCVSDRTCSETGQVCALDEGICVDCVRDADCEGGQDCVDHECGNRTGTDAGPIVGHDAGPRDGGPPLFSDSGPETFEDSGPGFDAGPFDAGPIVRFDAGAPLDASGPTCAPTAGSLLITEVMIASVLGGNDNGEWFEILNRTSCVIDLTGVVIDSPTVAGNPNSHTILSGFIGPGDYFVFAKHSDPVANHSLPFDYAYGPVLAPATVLVLSANDQLSLSYLGVVVDAVHWEESSRVGRTRQLAPASYSGDNSDSDLSMYCDGEDLYAVGPLGELIYGTPGAVNRPCPTP